MATVYLSGECRWAKLFKPDQKYNYYGLDVKLDDESLKKFHESGITTVKQAKDMEGWYSFKRRPDQTIWVNREQQRAGAPIVVDSEGMPMTELVGNGSNVTIKVETFRYDNAYGRGVGCRLEAVKVNHLVPYEDQKPANQTSQAEPPKLKIRF